MTLQMLPYLIVQACNLVEQTIEFLDDSRKKERVCYSWAWSENNCFFMLFARSMHV